MEKSSFFNSVSHDRTYKAEDWAEYFSIALSIVAIVLSLKRRK